MDVLIQLLPATLLLHRVHAKSQAVMLAMELVSKSTEIVMMVMLAPLIHVILPLVVFILHCLVRVIYATQEHVIQLWDVFRHRSIAMIAIHAHQIRVALPLAVPILFFLHAVLVKEESAAADPIALTISSTPSATIMCSVSMDTVHVYLLSKAQVK